MSASRATDPSPRPGRVIALASSAKARAIAAAAHTSGSSRVSAALATSPMRARNSVPMSARVAGRVGRGEDEQAERAALALVVERDQRQRERLRRRVEPLHRLEAGVDAAVRRRQAAREGLHVVADRAGERQRREHLGAAPDADRRLRDLELVLQLADEHVGQVGGVGGEHQRARPAVQLVGDGDVVLAVPDHLDDLALEALDLVAQHFHLPLLQRDGALAVRAGQLDAAEQLGVALEEARARGQEVGDIGLGDPLHAHRCGSLAVAHLVRLLTARSPLRKRFRRARS